MGKYVAKNQLNQTISTNAQEVYDKFVRLEIKEMRKCIAAAIRKNRSYLRSKARGYFKRDYPNAAKIGRFNDSMIQGVRYYKKIYENKEGDMVGIVSIGSTYKRGSGSFRIPMFEGGTVERHTRDGYNRGSIKASNFFKRANNDLEGVQRENYLREINKTIDKINRTKV